MMASRPFAGCPGSQIEPAHVVCRCRVVPRRARFAGDACPSVVARWLCLRCWCSSVAPLLPRLSLLPAPGQHVSSPARSPVQAARLPAVLAARRGSAPRCRRPRPFRGRALPAFRPLAYRPGPVGRPSPSGPGREFPHPAVAHQPSQRIPRPARRRNRSTLGSSGPRPRSVAAGALAVPAGVPGRAFGVARDVSFLARPAPAPGVQVPVAGPAKGSLSVTVAGRPRLTAAVILRDRR